MKSLSKYLTIFLAAVVLVGIAWYSGFKYNYTRSHVTESKTAIMERIEKVFKLVAVEGHISEIFSHKDYRYYDIPIFRKKALIRVNAKASVGYDFERLNLRVDEAAKTIFLDSFPAPEVLSIDHELEYYDMDEGTFNRFSGEELTKLNSTAKKYALEKAKESDLFEKAEEQKGEMLQMLEYIANTQGFKLEIQNSSQVLHN